MVVDMPYKTFLNKKEALKNSGMANLSDDKWNPGDIWAIDPSFKLTDLDTTSITALNLSLKTNYF